MDEVANEAPRSADDDPSATAGWIVVIVARHENSAHAAP